MIKTEHDATTGSFRLTLQPNASLTARESRLIVAVILCGMGTIGVIFAMLGAWPVLPFAGLEWLLLAWCMNRRLQVGAVREVITLSDNHLLWERGRDKPESSRSLQPAWVALDWVRPDNRNHPGRLYLRSHGRRLEIGSFLTENERETLAAELKKLLSDNRN